MPGDLRASRAPRLLSTCCLSLQGASTSPTCFSSHVYCFWSRALFLSMKRCLAAVIESSVFRFEILTISAVESETKYVEGIDLKQNKIPTADRNKRVQLTWTNLFGAQGHVSFPHVHCLSASLQPSPTMNNCPFHVIWTRGLSPNRTLSIAQQWKD